MCALKALSSFPGWDRLQMGQHQEECCCGGVFAASRLSSALRLLRMGVTSVDSASGSWSSWLSCSSSFISSSRSSLAASSNSPSGQTSHSSSPSVTPLLADGVVRDSIFDSSPVPKKSIPPFFVLTRFVHRKPINRNFIPGISRSSFAIMGSA